MLDRTRLRVRYAETDQMGRAYHAWHLVWFEAGRNSLFRNLGLPYHTLEKQGFFLPVRKVEVVYKAPVRYDEEITVETWISSHTRARVTCSNRILTETGRLAAEGSVELVLCNREGKPVLWPEEYHTLLERHRCDGP